MSHGKVINNKKGLSIAIIFTAFIMLIEFIGGLVTNSLALLSDSGHMLSDVSSLVFSLLAMWLALKPPTEKKLFGYHRVEILAALFNGATLLIIATLIIFEAYKRLLVPQTVSSVNMIIIAAIGMIANILSAWALLRQGDIKNNLNMRSAYLHIIGDALGSVGAIVAGLIMYYWNWYIADPIISVIVAVVILKGAWGVIKQSIHILMEGTPISIDSKQVTTILSSVSGVINVHELRIWTITSGIHSLSCHLLINEQSDSQEVLKNAISKIKGNFDIKYSTFQIEKQDLGEICKISNIR